MRSVILLLALVSAPAAAGDYRDLYKALEPTAKLDGLRYVKSDLRIASKNAAVKSETIRLVIHAHGGDIVVPVDAQGHASLPVDAALAQENPSVETNQPKGSVSISLNFDVRADPQQGFDYALLDAMLEDYRTAISRQGLMARMLAPKPDGLIVRFPRDVKGSATLTSNGAAQRFETDARGAIHIPDKPEWRNSGARIELSSLPQKIGLFFAGDAE